MTFHQVIQYFEDEQGVGRVVQVGDSAYPSTGRKVAIERRDWEEGPWYEVETLGAYMRSALVEGNKSAP